MNSIPQNLLRALRFTVKPGNLLYILLAALLFAEAYYGLSKQNFEINVGRRTAINFQLIAWILAATFAVFFCKTLDNAARLQAGLEDEPVAITPTTLLPIQLPLRFAVGFLALCYLTLRISALISATFLYSAISIFSLLAFVLMPAMMLVLLKSEDVRTVGSFADMGDAFADIGFDNYVAMLIISALTLGAFIAADHFWLAPAVQNRIIGELMTQVFSGKAETELVLPSMVYGYIFLSSLLFMFLAFFNHHFYASFFPQEAVDDDIASFSYGIDASEQQAIVSALNEHVTPPPSPAKREEEPAAAALEPPADFSLLADADISGMALDTQKALASALARADVLLASNQIDAGLALLTPFCDDKHDAAAFFPAYRRIYALAPQYALLQRLITAAAPGHQPSFELIHHPPVCQKPPDAPATHRQLPPRRPCPRQNRPRRQGATDAHANARPLRRASQSGANPRYPQTLASISGVAAKIARHADCSDIARKAGAWHKLRLK